MNGGATNMVAWRALFVAAVVLASMYLSKRFVDGTPPADFLVFWEAARADVVYRDVGRPFINPPTGLLLFKPLALLPFAPAYWLWSAASIGMFLLACRKTLGFLALASGAAIQGLILGQVAMLLGAMTLLAFTIPAFWGGILLGIAASVKPQFLLLAPLAMLVRRDWQMMWGSAVGLLLMVLASLVAFDPLLWAEWIRAASAAATPPGEVQNVITPAARAYAMGIPQMPAIIAGATIGGAAIILSARKVEPVMLAGLVIAASLLASPYAHPHDTIGIMPACIAIMLSGPWFMAIIAAGLFIGFKPHFIIALPALVIWYGMRAFAAGVGRGSATTCADSKPFAERQ